MTEENRDDLYETCDCELCVGVHKEGCDCDGCLEKVGIRFSSESEEECMDLEGR